MNIFCLLILSQIKTRFLFPLSSLLFQDLGELWFLQTFFSFPSFVINSFAAFICVHLLQENLVFLLEPILPQLLT